MSDIWWVLHCFACVKDAILVNELWRSTEMVKCGNCGAENTIRSIRRAMKAAGKEPKRYLTPANKTSGA